MRFIKKTLSVFTAALILVIYISTPVSAAISFTPDFDVYSEAALMINLDTGDVMYSKNADKQMVPASLTKIMTAVLLLEAYMNDVSALSTTYVSGGYECFDELYMTGASTADIQPNEKVSYKDLLYALILPSACEAANIIAVNIGGSISGFVEMMNLKAAQLGMTNTHFTNAHGLFVDNHYTTANDLAILTQYALSLPLFYEIASTEVYTMEATDYHQERTISHTNVMMSKGNGGQYYYEYVRGIKTGTLDEAGRCLISTASKDGYRYLLITLGAPMKDADGNNVMYNMIDHKNLYEWAFNTLEYTNIISGTEEIAEVPVDYGDGVDYVIVRPAEEYSRIWSSRVPIDSVHRDIELKENVIAPVKKGDVLGTMELQYGGDTLAVMELVATTDIARSRQKEIVAVAQSFIGSDEFFGACRWTAAFFLVYTVLIIILKIVAARINKKRAKLYTPKQPPKRSNNW